MLSLMSGSAPAWGEPSWRSVAATAGITAGWCLLCLVASRIATRQVRGGQMDRLTAGHHLNSQMQIFRYLSLPAVVMCLVGFSLAGWIAAVPIFADSKFLQSIVLLTPGIAILVATHLAEHLFRASVTPPNPRRRAADRTGPVTDALAVVGTTLRNGPAWLIVPTWIALAIGDVLTIPSVQAWLETLRFAPLLAIPLAIAALWSMPTLVGWLVKTEPMPPDVDAAVGDWLRGVGIPTGRWGQMRIRRWATGGRTANAMVVGYLPGNRLMLLSDRLIDDLTPSQLLLVVMHEVAHVRRWHIPLRIAALMLSFFASSWLATQFGWQDQEIYAGLLTLAGTALMLAIVGHLSEIDADLTACRLAVRATRCLPTEMVDAMRLPKTRDAAAAAMASALDEVTSGHPAARRASWLHPSLATRTRWLVNGSGDSARSEHSYCCHDANRPRRSAPARWLWRVVCQVPRPIGRTD